MTRTRLWYYILISLVLHLILLWLLRFLPRDITPERIAPVPVRMLAAPAPAPTPRPPPQTAERRETPKKAPSPPPKEGGVLADLPKPQVEERPDRARIVSRFDSRAQDIGPGERGTVKPSGQNPPPSPPELALPERYDGDKTKKQALVQPQSQPSAAKSERETDQVRPQPPAAQKTAPKPLRPSLKSKGRQYQITKEQEVAMLQRDQNESPQTPRESLDEHFDRLSRLQPLPTFDAPGVYEQGPERPGEGSDNTGGGKFRSVDAYGLKYFSYLLGVEQQIELVFSVPFFDPQNSRIGVPIVGFTIQRSGELSEAVLLRSSGHRIVDQALLDAVRRAAPYGPFPKHLPDRAISIRVFVSS